MIFSEKPVSTPDQVRGRLFRDHALARHGHRRRHRHALGGDGRAQAVGGVGNDPSTPRSMTRSMSGRSVTVHGMTLPPSDFAWATLSAVRSAKWGDRVWQPAAATRRGVEPP